MDLSPKTKRERLVWVSGFFFGVAVGAGTVFVGLIYTLGAAV